MKKDVKDYCKYYHEERECPYQSDKRVACLFWKLEKDFFYEKEEGFRKHWIDISNGHLPWNKKETPDFPKTPTVVKAMLWYAWDIFANMSGSGWELLVQYGKELPVEVPEEDQFNMMMLWKLGLGNMSNFFMGEDPMPEKNVAATAESWKTEEMPPVGDDVSECELFMIVTDAQMQILRKGHIPDAQEDHWFMYCNDEYIRYYRSWTGMCAFEAHYARSGEFFCIDIVRINRNLAEFGVNGDEAGAYLFRYLIAAESGQDAQKAWDEYLAAWKRLDEKYHPKPRPKPADDWYVGVEGKVCKGCMYCGGIRRCKDDDPNSEIAGCGRLFRESFKKCYLSGVCMYRQTSWNDPSEFEKQKQKEWEKKKEQKTVVVKKNTEYYDDFSIAGFKFSDGLMVFDQLKVGARLKMVRETDNKYDSNAIAIYFGDYKLGYVPRSNNAELAKFLDLGWSDTFMCRINRISADRIPNDQIGVTVFITRRRAICLDYVKKC